MVEIVPDSQHRSLVARLPGWARDLALLARFDRPIGWQLLFWPGAWSVALAGGAWARVGLIGWLLIGAVAMRGAGCVYNDIVDRDLDRRVARTAARPVASGAVSVRVAWGWLAVLCLVGLVVLLQLTARAAIVAVVSLLPVAAYPYMKRVTWWPQAWLGVVFSWAALVGWSEVEGEYAGTQGLTTAGYLYYFGPGLLLYAGTIAWVVGYDTIYALQDIEDDPLVGVRSSARALGTQVRAGVATFYLVALAFWALAIWVIRPDWVALLALGPVAAHLAWQVATLRPADGGNALDRFRSNRVAGLLMFAACVTVGSTS